MYLSSLVVLSSQGITTCSWMDACLAAESSCCDIQTRARPETHAMFSICAETDKNVLVKEAVRSCETLVRWMDT